MSGGYMYKVPPPYVPPGEDERLRQQQQYQYNQPPPPPPPPSQQQQQQQQQQFQSPPPPGQNYGNFNVNPVLGGIQPGSTTGVSPYGTGQQQNLAFLQHNTPTTTSNFAPPPSFLPQNQQSFLPQNTGQNSNQPQHWVTPSQQHQYNNPSSNIGVNYLPNPNLGLNQSDYGRNSFQNTQSFPGQTPYTGQGGYDQHHSSGQPSIGNTNDFQQIQGNTTFSSYQGPVQGPYGQQQNQEVPQSYVPNAGTGAYDSFNGIPSYQLNAGSTPTGFSSYNNPNIALNSFVDNFGHATLNSGPNNSYVQSNNQIQQGPTQGQGPPQWTVDSFVASTQNAQVQGSSQNWQTQSGSTSLGHHEPGSYSKDAEAAFYATVTPPPPEAPKPQRPDTSAKFFAATADAVKTPAPAPTPPPSQAAQPSTANQNRNSWLSSSTGGFAGGIPQVPDSQDGVNMTLPVSEMPAKTPPLPPRNYAPSSNVDLGQGSTFPTTNLESLSEGNVQSTTNHQVTVQAQQQHQFAGSQNVPPAQTSQSQVYQNDTRSQSVHSSDRNAGGLVSSPSSSFSSIKDNRRQSSSFTSSDQANKRASAVYYTQPGLPDVSSFLPDQKRTSIYASPQMQFALPPKDPNQQDHYGQDSKNNQTSTSMNDVRTGSFSSRDPGIIQTNMPPPSQASDDNIHQVDRVNSASLVHQTLYGGRKPVGSGSRSQTPGSVTTPTSNHRDSVYGSGAPTLYDLITQQAPQSSSAPLIQNETNKTSTTSDTQDINIVESTYKFQPGLEQKGLQNRFNPPETRDSTTQTILDAKSIEALEKGASSQVETPDLRIAVRSVLPAGIDSYYVDSIMRYIKTVQREVAGKTNAERLKVFREFLEDEAYHRGERYSDAPFSSYAPAPSGLGVTGLNLSTGRGDFASDNLNPSEEHDLDDEDDSDALDSPISSAILSLQRDQSVASPNPSILDIRGAEKQSDFALSSHVIGEDIAPQPLAPKRGSVVSTNKSLSPGITSPKFVPPTLPRKPEPYHSNISTDEALTRSIDLKTSPHLGSAPLRHESPRQDRSVASSSPGLVRAEDLPPQHNNIKDSATPSIEKNNKKRPLSLHNDTPGETNTSPGLSNVKSDSAPFVPPVQTKHRNSTSRFAVQAARPVSIIEDSAYRPPMYMAGQDRSVSLNQFEGLSKTTSPPPRFDFPNALVPGPTSQSIDTPSIVENEWSIESKDPFKDHRPIVQQELIPQSDSRTLPSAEARSTRNPSTPYDEPAGPVKQSIEQDYVVVNESVEDLPPPSSQFHPGGSPDARHHNKSSVIDISALTKTMGTYRDVAPDTSHLLESSRKLLDLSETNFDFIDDKRRSYDAAYKKRRDAYENERDRAKSDHDEIVDRLYAEQKIVYEDINDMDAKFERDQMEKRERQEEHEFQMYKEELFDPSYQFLQKRIALLNEQYQKSVQMTKTATSGREKFQNQNTRPELMAILTLLLDTYDAISNQQKKLQETIFDRNKRYKQSVLGPIVDNVKLREMKKDFDEDEKRQAVKFAESALERAKLLRGTFDECMYTGLELDFAFFDEVAQVVNKVLEQLAAAAASSSDPSDPNKEKEYYTGENKPLLVKELNYAYDVLKSLTMTQAAMMQSYHKANTSLNLSEGVLATAEAKLKNLSNEELKQMEEENREHGKTLDMELNDRLEDVNGHFKETEDILVPVLEKLKVDRTS